MTYSFFAQESRDSTFFGAPETANLQSGIVIECGYQNATYMSVGGVVGQGIGMLRHNSIGFGASLDVFYNGTTAYFGPRIFGGMNFSDFVGFRVGAANYFKENSPINDFRFLLEICFTIGGRFGINGGFSLPVIPSNIHADLSYFRAGVTVNLAK
jgi:hypothetical protein